VDRFPVAIGPEEGAALREWVIREGATRSIEAGLGWAVSTLHICEGLKRVRSAVSTNGPSSARARQTNCSGPSLRLSTS